MKRNFRNKYNFLKFDFNYILIEEIIFKYYFFVLPSRNINDFKLNLINNFNIIL